jgi:hypothetical protein
VCRRSEANHRVRRFDDLRDDRSEIGGVVLGVIRRWRHVIAVAVAAVVEQDDAVLAKLARAEPPNPAMAAVPVLRLGCGRILVAAGAWICVGLPTCAS